MSGAQEIARAASIASTELKRVKGIDRVTALEKVYKGLKAHKDEIIAANQKDVEDAETNNLPSALVKRLDLSKGDKYDSMLQGILDVANLEDPVGRITLHRKLDDGLDLMRVTCPIGVLLVIFESRPEVIANITALALKSGNAAILKGGKESSHSFAAIAKVITQSLESTKIPSRAIQLVQSRQEVSDLLSQDKYIDLVIPRGGNELVRNIKNNTRIPVLGHADGLCAIYLNDDADLRKAIRIIVDAKTNYPAGCNAVETLLIQESAINTLWPQIADALNNAGVTIRGTLEILEPLKNNSNLDKSLLIECQEQDFDTEFLSLTIAVKGVASVEDAVIHINTHSSKHTDAIITESKETAKLFMDGVDSAGVYWNASTRFADGFRYGFGTEVGISTNKIHSRGPVGLEGLVIYQYRIMGNGQVASDYKGAGGNKSFLHKNMQF